MKYLAQFVCSVVTLHAQAPAILEYTGKPLTVRVNCTGEMIHDLGLSCTPDEPCPVYLELSDIQPVGDRLVVAGNLHTSTTTLESILLASDDAGKTWIEAHPRVAMAVLDRVQFYDFETGWINGHVLQAVPKDAFFLITSDGGKTWRKRPLSGESRPGAIEQYWFDSRTHGLLVIERPQSEDGIKHEMWESMTGGDSWNVRQVDSKPIPLSRLEGPRAWRIQSDSKTQSHRIERQAGAKWEVVASFRVNPGECKPAPPPEAEPPKEPPPVEETPAPKPPASKRPPSLKPKSGR